MGMEVVRVKSETRTIDNMLCEIGMRWIELGKKKGLQSNGIEKDFIRNGLDSRGVTTRQETSARLASRAPYVRGKGQLAENVR